MQPVREEELSGGLIRRITLPILILIIGLTLTSAAALMAQASAVREQDLLFDAASDTEIRNFELALEDRIDEFDDAIDFVSATFPASPAAFESFFSSTSVEPDELGLALIERVDVEGIGALEAREVLMGEQDFSVTSFSNDQEPRYVITRLVADNDVGLGTIYGADVRPFLEEGLLEDLITQQSFSIPIDEVGTLTEPFEPLSEDFGLRRTMLAKRIDDEDTGVALGWLVRFLDIDDVLQGVTAESEMEINAELSFLGQSAIVIDVDEETTSSPDDTSLSRTVEIQRDATEWTLTVWADQGFGVATGLLEQTTIWLIGIILTFVIFAAAIFWVVNRQLLDNASFELKHARTLASTDPLTGLLNRKGFVEAVEGQDLTVGGVVIFIDLDGFKGVNDTLGHAEGDRVLQSVAQIIRQQFRNSDIVSRFGGDEFMVYASKQLADNERGDVAKRVVDAIAEADLGVTSSVGSAERPPYDLTPVETMIRKADRAMYRAKEAGGNRVERSVKRQL